MRSSIVMDHNNIPTCALYRHIGTVIVRFKMEMSNVLCCQRDVCPASECSGSIHRPSRCEQCTRTRLISKCDCGSDIVDRCRPYRSSASRNRYVNVCAAVCLLLLVGGLSPQSSAAPGRSRAVMSRQRRDVGNESLWENPCDFANTNNSTSNAENAKQDAEKLVKQAKDAIASASLYKNDFARVLYSENNYDDLVSQSSGEWLLHFNLPEEVLPKEMPEAYISDLMNRIDDVLPSMFKALKLIVAGLNSFITEGLKPGVTNSDENLKTKLNLTLQDVRAVLCYFQMIMSARNLEQLRLPLSEAPEFNSTNYLNDGQFLFRDTLNYLEYLILVFKKLYGISA